jgi:limonene-1,2-epoxide hydrolase
MRSKEVMRNLTELGAAEALGAAVKARSTEQVAAVYADDILVWHACTGQAMGKSHNVELLGRVFEVTAELEYIDVRRIPLDGVVVQQHRVAGRLSDGKQLVPLEVCMIMRVRAGLITRIDEYFDRGNFAEVFARVAALGVSGT